MPKNLNFSETSLRILKTRQQNNNTRLLNHKLESHEMHTAWQEVINYLHCMSFIELIFKLLLCGELVSLKYCLSRGLYE